MRLIDADKMLVELLMINERSNIFAAPFARRIKRFIDVQLTAEERKHGRWVYDDPFGALPKCSECGCRSRDAAAKECAIPYCPYCGAAMDKEPNND